VSPGLAQRLSDAGFFLFLFSYILSYMQQDQEILPPEQAREWLNEFLVEQQEESK